MTPDWLVALGAIIAAAAGYFGYFFTARHNRRLLEEQQKTRSAETKMGMAQLQNTLIDQLQEERNRMDTKIETMRKQHNAEILQMRESFESRIAEVAQGEALARQYVSVLLQHVPPPPPAPPAGYKP